MNILTVSGITKSYSRRLLFDDASFFLQEGEKAGVLGINGTGKSTLLKMIAGIDEPDQGEIIMANHVVVRYLPQNPVFEEEETVLQSVVRGNKTKENEWKSLSAEYENNVWEQIFQKNDSNFKEAFAGYRSKKAAFVKKV